jgi:hypothetical protein
MSNPGRKDPRNFGGTFDKSKTPFFDVEAARIRTSVTIPERVLLGILRTEVDRLAADKSELERFFSHFFDPLTDKNERDSWVNSFTKRPPKVVLGYPRTSSEFPCYSVVLEAERETDEPLGHYLGQSLEDEGGDTSFEYTGSMFEQTFGIYVYAEHPDVCIYLYQFAKAVYLGAHETMLCCGLIDPSYSGGELAPDEGYLPENMFVRVLRVSLKSLTTVPRVLSPDPSRARVTGIFADDIVVSGVRGGVHPIDPNAEE